MKKQAQIILIATDKAEIGTLMKCYNEHDSSDKDGNSITITENILCINQNYRITGKNEFWEPQHIYIVTDDEIKVNDWVIMGNGNLNKMTDTDMIFYLDSMSNATKKVVATTNSDLKLPLIDLDFINNWINESNSGDIISNIELEYKKVFDTSFKNGIEENIPTYQIVYPKLKRNWDDFQNEVKDVLKDHNYYNLSTSVIFKILSDAGYNPPTKK